MGRLYDEWKLKSGIFKAVAIGGFLVVMALVSGGVGGCVSQMKDAKLDKVQAEREAQIQAITTEREQAIGRAEAAEARAKELESQVAINETIIKAQGAKAEAAKEKLTEENERYEKEIESVGDDVDSCTRMQHICERAKSLNLYPKNKECPECSTQ